MMTADRYVYPTVFCLVLAAGVLGAVASTPLPATRAVFREAGFSITPDGDFVFHESSQLVGSHCVIDSRVTAKREAGDFKEAVEQQVAFRKRLSRTVKESQYHQFIQKGAFISKSGIQGVRCVFGIHIDRSYVCCADRVRTLF